MRGVLVFSCGVGLLWMREKGAYVFVFWLGQVVGGEKGGETFSTTESGGMGVAVEQ